MVHNTLVMTYSGSGFVVAPSGTQSVRLTANIFAGIGAPRVIGGGVAGGAVTQLNNLATATSNFSAVDNVAAPNFWPNATVQAQLGLPTVLDATYLNDAPQPLTLRPLRSGARMIGALQSSR
jgi:hypothetical protein